MNDNSSGYKTASGSGYNVASGRGPGSQNPMESVFDAAASTKLEEGSYDEIIEDFNGFLHKIKHDDEKIRQGAMGSSSKAKLLEDNTEQAIFIKRIPANPPPGSDKNYTAKLNLFKNEAIITCQYGSKGRYLSTGMFIGKDEQGNLCLVTEFYAGDDLKDHIERGEYRQDTGACKFIIRGLLEGLVELHDQGVIHRDLKPENIKVVRETGKPVILDFGLAVHKTGLKESKLMMAGTFGYSAPELQDGSGRDATFASDIYSVGVIFVEMLTPDFDHSKEKFGDSLNKGIEDLDKNNATLFKNFILKCLKENPEDRFQTADEALEEFICIVSAAHNEFRKKCVFPYWDDGKIDPKELEALRELRKQSGVTKDEFSNDLVSAKATYDAFCKEVEESLKDGGSKNREYLINLAREKSGQPILLKDFNRIVEEQRAKLLSSNLEDDQKKAIRKALRPKTRRKVYAAAAGFAVILFVLLLSIFQSKEDFVIPKDVMARNALLFQASKTGNALYVSRLLKAGVFVNTRDSSGATALFGAVEVGALPTVDTLLNHKADVNIADKQGWTPLFMAAMRGNASIVERLIQNGADVGAVDKRGQPVISLALKSGHDNVVQVMLRHMPHQDIERQYDVLLANTSSEKTRKYLIEAKEKIAQIKTSIEEDNVNHLTAALAYRFNRDLNYTDSTGKTWVHVAAANGSFKCLDYLLSQNMDVNARDSLGQTPIFLASQSGSMDMVRALVLKGADIQIENAEGKTFLSLIKSKDIRKFVIDRMYADSLFVKISQKGDQDEMNRYIGEGAHVDAKDSRSNTALAYAVQRKDLKTMKFLMSKGARINDSFEKGNTLMHFAAATGDVDVMSELLAAHADYNTQNAAGETPLMVAINNRKWGAVNLLLAQKELSLAAVDKNMNNMMHYAANSGVVDLVKKMSAAKVDVNVYNKEHRNPLHLAAMAGVLESVQLLEEMGVSLGAKDAYGKKPVDYARVPQVKKFLYDNEHKNDLIFDAVRKKNYKQVQEFIASGAKVNGADKQGTPLLHLAVSRDTLLMALLLNNGAMVDATDAKNESALFTAVRMKSVDAVKCLVKHGAKVDNLSWDNNSAMHIAAAGDDVNIMSALLVAKANFNIKNGAGQTPLMVALGGRKWKAVDLLLSQKGISVSDVDGDKNNIMHYAAASGNVALMEKLSSKVTANAYNKEGKSPMHLAAAVGSLDGVRLLERAGVPLNVRDAYGKKPVDYARVPQVKKFLFDNEYKNELIFDAVKSKNVKAILEYLNYGAKINNVDSKGIPLLHFAVAKDSTVLSLLLNKGANVNAVDGNMETALFKAVRMRSWEAIKCLVAHGADTRRSNVNGEKIGHIAAATKDTDIAKWALSHVSVNDVDSKQETPLFIAVRNNDINMADYLMKRGVNSKRANSRGQTAMTVVENAASAHVANVTFRDERFLASMAKDDLKHAPFYLKLGADIDAVDQSSNTATCLAAQNDAVNRLKFLEKYNADMNKECRSLTPLGWAVQLNQKKAIKQLVETKSVVTTLLQSNGNTPLHMAVLGGKTDIVNMILRRADVNAPDRDGKPALVVAIEGNQINMTKLLLDRGAHQGWRDSNGDSPIHLAARRGASSEIVKALISHGANVEARNNDGDDPLDIVEETNNEAAYEEIYDAHSWGFWKWVKHLFR